VLNARSGKAVFFGLIKVEKALSAFQKLNLQI